MTRTVARVEAWPIAAILMLLCVIGLAERAIAGQTQEASIIGLVTDESGAVLPGVTVTVSSPALQVKQMVDVTNVRGEYRVTPLPLGLYSVDYTLSGFQTLRRTDLRLTAGFVAKIDVVLKVGGVAETVTVSGQSPVVDVKTTAAGTQLTRELLESVPAGRNGLSSLLNLATGARPGLDFGQFNQDNPIYRAFGRDNNAWVNIEGVATTSPWSSASGLGSVLLYDSTEEATVQTLGSSAESPTAGIQLSVITKSGGNEFHGGGSLSQFAQWMQGDNVDAALAAQGVTTNKILERWDRSGDLGGRIVRDKLWFYGSAKKRKDVTPILGLFQPDGSQGVLGVSEPIVLGKLLYQLKPSQRLIAWGQWGAKRTDASNATRFTDWDSRGDHTTRNSVGKVEWQVARGAKFISVQVGSWTSEGGPHTGFVNTPSTVDQVTQRVTGTDIDTGVISNYGRWDSKATLSWYKPELFLGNHDFKAGFNYQVARGDGPTVDRGVAGNYQLIFRSGVPFEVSARNNPANSQSRMVYVPLYVQDSWAIGRRLTLNLGVRYAHDHSYLPEQCRVAAPAPFATLYPAQCFPETEPVKAWNPVTPRLHASYDLTGDGKTVIKGGWGRFAVMHGSDELLIANQNADISTIFRWHDLNGDNLYQPGEVNLDTNGPDFVSKTPSANASLVGLVDNPDLKEPGSDEFTASIERQVMAGFGIRVSGIYSKSFNTLRLENTLRPYSAYNIPITNLDPGPDGKLGTADDTGRTITYYDYPASLAGLAFQRPRFINDAASDASYKSFEIAASKRLSNRWQFMASYSATKSEIPFVPNLTGNKVTTLATYDPNAEIFTGNHTWEWQTRLSGSYLFPYGVQASANFVNQSGAPWARTVSVTGGKQIPSITVRVEPIGTERIPSANLLNLRLEKGFRINTGQKIVVRGQVYNALNINTVVTTIVNTINLTQQSGASYGQPTLIPNPRVGEFVLTYSF